MKDEANLTRIEWIDTLKGFLILLVVIGHMIGHQERTYGLYSFIYTFHMPLFFMVSGWLSIDLCKKNIKTYAIRKVTTLLIPFFSFAVITSFLKGWDLFPLFFLTDNKHGLWFLLVLFMFCLLLIGSCKIALRLPSPRFVRNKPLLGPFREGTLFCFWEVVFIVTWFVLTPSLRDILIPKTLFLYWPFFIMGYMISNYKIKVPEFIIGICGLSFLVVWWGSLKYGLTNEALYQFSRLCACIFFFYCFMNISTSWVTKKFSVLGKETLCIYVMHYWFYQGISAFVLSNCGGFALFETVAFVIIATMISIISIMIKRVLCTNKLLGLILFGQQTKKR